MAYVSVPKDLSKIKSKVLFSLTQRQLICFSAGAVIGVPLFFLLRNRIGVSSAALVMMFVMVPAFLLAMYEKNGQPLEKVLWNIINVLFLRPKQRPYPAAKPPMKESLKSRLEEAKQMVRASSPSRAAPAKGTER